MLAKLLDLMVAGVVANVLFIPLSVAPESEGLFLALSLLSLLLAVFAYPIVMEACAGGRTVGKLAVGLQVVTLSGGPIGARHAVSRGLLGAVDVWASAGVVGIVTIVTTKRSQRVGDMVAGTVVVRVRRPKVAPMAGPLGLGAFGAFIESLDVGSVPAEELELAYQLSHRGDPSQRHADRVARLADRIDGRLGVRPPGMTPGAFLACVVAARQRGRMAPRGLEREGRSSQVAASL